MADVRIIPRLDIKSAKLIKSIQLEGLRVVGDPSEYAKWYYLQGADELLFMDAVASLYERNHLGDIIEELSASIFVPIVVGGGIRSLSDARAILARGADKVAVNTAALRRPKLLYEIAQEFGSQSLVLSVDAKLQPSGVWEAYSDGGREHSGWLVDEWICEAQAYGVGELLVTSIDREGMRNGFDLELAEMVSKIATVPVILSGGFGEASHIKNLTEVASIDGIAVAHSLHYRQSAISELKSLVSQK